MSMQKRPRLNDPLQPDSMDSNYDQFVVVAEQKWTLDADGNVQVKFISQFGGLDWVIDTTPMTPPQPMPMPMQFNSAQNHNLRLSCKQVDDGLIASVHIEVHALFFVTSTCPMSMVQQGGGTLHQQQQMVPRKSMPRPVRSMAAGPIDPALYEGWGVGAGPLLGQQAPFGVGVPGPAAAFEEMGPVMREQTSLLRKSSQLVLLNAQNPHWSEFRGSSRVVLHVRVLKNREQFADFSRATLSMGALKCDRKLMLGQRVFHVSEQLLSYHSRYFDRLFSDSRADIIPLPDEKADPIAFQDFLLCMLPADKHEEVLPNNKNVEELLRLAGFYQVLVRKWYFADRHFLKVDLVKKKCERHLESSPDMDIKQRILLAHNYGFGQIEERLLREITQEEGSRMISMLLDRLDAKQ